MPNSYEMDSKSIPPGFFNVKGVLNRNSERISRRLSKRIEDPDFVPINIRYFKIDINHL